MQMRNQLKESLKTPVEEWFKGKIIRHDHFHDLVDIDNALNSVPEHLRIEDRRRYTESCFGHFLKMHCKIHFSVGIVHRLLLRELHHDGPEDGMRFLLGKHSVWFSNVEFYLITGLKFGVIPDIERYDMIFSFEVIPELGNKKCGTRRAISELPPPCILKWELSQRPWGRKLDCIFTERMFARRELVPTSVEMAQRYYEGIDLGGSLYDTDVANIPGHVPEHERRMSARLIDTEGAYSGPSDTDGAYSGPSDREGPYSGPSDRDGAYSVPNDTEGSNQEGGSRSPLRRQLVRFTLPKQPRPRGDSVSKGRGESPERHIRVRFTMPRQFRPGGDSRGGVDGHPQGWDRKFIEVMDDVQSLRVDVMEAIRKSDEKRDQQHQKLLDMIRALQGQVRVRVRHRSPVWMVHYSMTITETLVPQVGQPGHVMTERTEVPGGTEIALLEQVPPPVLPDGSACTEIGLLVREPHVLQHDLVYGSLLQRTPPPVDPSAVRPLKRSRRNSPTHQRDTGRESDTRSERSSSERSPSRGDTRRERSSSHHSPPHRDTRRQRSSSQCSPPHSNPRRQRSSLLRTPPVESSSRACSPPQIQR
ncbi:hypothetical protein LWI28_024436 [Acer negundo]|uniref:Uncharacterized protein n=1 Tax=Acer negundo TaxID=4023 RepID=A0AAD5J1J3_ACENE|nr:hypothetical protein LWI28_024436 [Acer negundo]